MQDKKSSPLDSFIFDEEGWQAMLVTPFYLLAMASCMLFGFAVLLVGRKDALKFDDE